MEHKDTIHLSDRTDRCVYCNVTIHEINVIDSCAEGGRVLVFQRCKLSSSWNEAKIPMANFRLKKRLGQCVTCRNDQQVSIDQWTFKVYMQSMYVMANELLLFQFTNHIRTADDDNRLMDLLSFCAFYHVKNSIRCTVIDENYAVLWDLRARLGRPMSVFKCFRTSFIKPKHRRLLALLLNHVSPSESGLEGLLFCCAVTIRWKGAGRLDWQFGLLKKRSTQTWLSSSITATYRIFKDKNQLCKTSKTSLSKHK